MAPESPPQPPPPGRKRLPVPGGRYPFQNGEVAPQPSTEMPPPPSPPGALRDGCRLLTPAPPWGQPLARPRWWRGPGVGVADAEQGLHLHHPAVDGGLVGDGLAGGPWQAVVEEGAGNQRANAGPTVLRFAHPCCWTCVYLSSPLEMTIVSLKKGNGFEGPCDDQERTGNSVVSIHTEALFLHNVIQWN